MPPSESSQEWFSLLDVSHMLHISYVDVLAAVTKLAQNTQLKIKRPFIPGQNWQWCVHRDVLPVVYQHFYGTQVMRRAIELEHQNSLITLPLPDKGGIDEIDPPLT